MNQVTNLIQWKNLTEEDQADFDFENYVYIRQKPDGMDFEPTIKAYFGLKDTDFISNQAVYRLKVEPEKWYYYGALVKGCIYEDVAQGHNLTNLESYKILRPAKESEIPKDERTLERKIEDKWPDKEVNFFEYREIYGGEVLCFRDLSMKVPHSAAQLMKGFAGYVYDFTEGKGGDLTERGYAVMNVNNKYLHPVAVLFEGES